MKTYLCLFLVMLLFPFSLHLQENKPTVHIASNGLFIEITHRVLKNSYFKIYRKEGNDTNFLDIATIRMPEKFEDFYKALNLSNSKNPIYDLPKPTILPKLWEIVLRTETLDSIPFFGWLPYFQEALGCGFYDVSVQNGLDYVYKIQEYSDNRLKNEYVTESVTFHPIIRDFKMRHSFFEAGEKYVKVVFTCPTGKNPYKVRVFRNVYLQTDYTEIMPNVIYYIAKDTVFASIIDTTVIKGVIYDYYVVPIDLYGNAGMPSDTVRVINSFNKSENYIQAVRTKSLDSLNAIEISWKCDATKYMRSINIYRNNDYEGNYRLIGNALPTDTSFIDTQVNPIQTYYYYLVINDLFGESVRSPRVTGMLRANRKAEPPLDFKVSQIGEAIKLTWTRPSADTRGYYVFRTTGQENDTLMQVSDLIVNSDLEVTYIDSLKNINSPMLGYSVKSVNTSYDISEGTEIQYISPIVKRTISTPMNLKALLQDGKILLTWEEPLNNNFDIVAYNVYRKLLKVDGSDSTNFQKLPNTIENEGKNYYLDTSVCEGNAYLYSVEAIGFGESKSALSAPSVVYIPKTKPISIQSIYTGVSEKGILLQWDKTMQNSIKSYNIYRLKGNESPVKIASLNVETTEYFDPLVLDETPVFYAITCVDDKGNESEIEEWTKVSK